ncbi:probable beta-galactosidase [Thermoplasma acidophilum]|uniref:Probable beta-galactosidase n=1 Tax=Thermoplasma acidophilum (strain ATCC 25905 / DSM 1728 / JCM 9062 / NBRC 15155 / AMRC-C165) TaxID=273075 RepID=Q9HIL6_THEAC|nr:beta-galactosidase BgaS [Thermoplasma acidophilum]CAC12444.1 probable beta-galactosidase [Thermoplasma acidophilum]
MFPKGFKFGFSEAGFQFEMGISDPDPNTDWYVWTHDKYNIQNHVVSGDLPENGAGYWDLYHRDHDFAQHLGMNAARIGIEWSRIFPKSTEEVKVSVQNDRGDVLNVDITDRDLDKLDKIANKDAVNHYRSIFSDFKNRGNYLIINLYHWSTPVWINDPSKRDIEKDNAVGNCFTTRSIVEFAKFAAYVARAFDDLADRWSTMNEPNILFNGQCSNDWRPDSMAIRKKLFAEAHARAYDSIKKFSEKPVGIVYANGDMQPLTDEDREARDLAEYEIRYSFFDAITKGDLSWYANAAQNRSLDYSSDKREDMANHLDWVGVNYYSRDVVKKDGDRWAIVPGYGYATGENKRSLDGRSSSDTGWEVYPEGIYHLVMSYQKHIGLPMMISENGVADDSDRLRPRYVASHLKNLESAIRDGAKVEGYLHWALTDNYEWASGFSKKFGLLKVDFKTKKRYIRPGALVFKEIVENNGVDEDLEWLAADKF